jgi:hypothetical protein
MPRQPTPIDPTKQFARAARLSARGQQAQTKAQRFVDFMAIEIGLNPDELVAPELWDEAGKPIKIVTRGEPKEPQRTVEKANAKHGGRVEDVADAGTRFTTIFRHAPQILHLRSLLPREGEKGNKLTEFWAKKGIILVSYDDHFLDPKEHGYVGFDLKFKVLQKGGFFSNCEDKFLYEHMRATDFYTRGAYKEMRKIRDNAKTQGRKLTESEEQASERYKQQIKGAYEADMKNPAYGLDILSGDARSPNRRWRGDKERRYAVRTAHWTLNGEPAP